MHCWNSDPCPCESLISWIKFNTLHKDIKGMVVIVNVPPQSTQHWNQYAPITWSPLVIWSTHEDKRTQNCCTQNCCTRRSQGNLWHIKRKYTCPPTLWEINFLESIVWISATLNTESFVLVSKVMDIDKIWWKKNRLQQDQVCSARVTLLFLRKVTSGIPDFLSHEETSCPKCHLLMDWLDGSSLNVWRINPN